MNARSSLSRRRHAAVSFPKVRIVLLMSPILVVMAGDSAADEPITQRVRWDGRIGYHATGAALAIDTDGDQRVDTVQPASVAVSSIPAGATLLGAYLYWGGTIPQAAGPCEGAPDSQLTFTPPGGAPASVDADVLYCADGGSSSYDIGIARADVTSRITDLNGVYSAADYEGLVSGGSTDNASFSIVLIYSHESLPGTSILLYDGCVTVVSGTETITSAGLHVDEPRGSATHYVLDGDLTGGAGEQVAVTGQPGGGTLVLSDAINPPTNPMNQTINVTASPTVGTIGVDIDRFDIAGALAAGDTDLDVEFQADTDKWWLVYEVVEASLFLDASGVGESTSPAAAAILYPVLPTPSPRGATISFELRTEGFARLVIQDVGGRVVSRPFDGTLDAGRHDWEWDLHDRSGARVASGIYFVRLQLDGTVLTRKVVVVD